MTRLGGGGAGGGGGRGEGVGEGGRRAGSVRSAPLDMTVRPALLFHTLLPILVPGEAVDARVREAVTITRRVRAVSPPAATALTATAAIYVAALPLYFWYPGKH